jgi:MFS transporter, DHA1 family, inner membrane transport protein
LTALTEQIHLRNPQNLFKQTEPPLANVPPLQSYVVQIAREVSPGAVDVASGLNIGAFNLGIAGGAWAGGLVVEGIGLAAAPYIAAAVVAVGIILVRLSGRLNATAPQAVAAE